MVKFNDDLGATWRFPSAYLNDSGQAKVGNLAGVVLGHQDVPGRQVSVDALLLLQVAHPISHLDTHVHQGGHVLVLALRIWNQPTTTVLKRSGLTQQGESRK